MQRAREDDVEVEVEAAKVVDCEVTEEVDALDRVVRERGKQRRPRRLALVDEIADCLIIEKEVLVVGVRPPRVREQLGKEQSADGAGSVVLYGAGSVVLSGATFSADYKPMAHEAPLPWMFARGCFRVGVEREKMQNVEMPRCKEEVV